MSETTIFQVTRNLSNKQVRVGEITIIETETGLDVKGKADPATPDNIERMAQIVRRVKRSYGIPIVELTTDNTSGEGFDPLHIE